VALALEKAPDIAAKVGRCVVMGGAACTVGNVTPAAEYNIWCDPEAARTVFRSGMPLEMVGWELCRGGANLDDGDIARCPTPWRWRWRSSRASRHAPAVTPSRSSARARSPGA
jgi:inosine-uridine nucleoside N-ribohydrolase